MKYFSSFAAGFEKLAEHFLRADLSPAQTRVMSGAIIFEAAASPAEIQKIKYFKNTCLIIKEFPHADGIEKMTAVTLPQKIRVPPRARTFKLTFSDRNRLIGVSGKSKAKLVSALERATGLKYGAAAGDVEFQFLLRDAGDGFFLQRITKSPPPTVPGELESHIAQMLVRTAEPKAGNVFIDPFAGSGAIALTRADAAPYRGIFAMDMNADLMKKLKSRVAKIKNSKMQRSFFVKSGDFLKNGFQDHFADEIVTDPPWGEFQKIGADFYPRVFTEFARILKPGGRLVVLTGRDITPLPCAALAETAEYDVLIHGKKAKILTFQKRP